MKMTDEAQVEAVMGGVRMGVNVAIQRTDGKQASRPAANFPGLNI
jgi:hypothetical protein